MKRSLVIFFALALVLSGCSHTGPQQPQLGIQEQSLNIQLGAEPFTLDPTFCADTTTATYLAHLFEGLTILNSNQEVTPGIAESWEVKENILGLPVYTFHLNPKACWSDGTAVKASDFVYAWKRALSTEIQAPRAYQLYPIKGARVMKESAQETGGKEKEASAPLEAVALDENTLQVTLEGPCPYFLELCASEPVYLPLKEEIIQQYPETWTNAPESLISNGAYKLESWVHDGSIRMTKNPYYHQSRRLVQENLNFILTGDDNATWEAFQQGQLQFANIFPLLYLEEAQKIGALQISPKMSTYALIFRVDGVEDLKVRQALSLAINRAALTGDVLADGSLPAGAIIPQGVPGATVGQDFRGEAGEYLSTASAHYVSNLERARAILKEAGYENGQGLPGITYLTNDTLGNHKIAQAVAADWSALGIQVQIQALGWNDYLAARDAGEFDVARYTFLAEGHTDPVAFLDLWTSQNPLNLSGYKNERFDALIAATYTGEVLSSETENNKENISADESEEETTRARRLRVGYLHEAESLLVSQDAIVIPLYYYPDIMLISPQLTHVSISPLGIRWFGEAVYTPTAK